MRGTMFRRVPFLLLGLAALFASSATVAKNVVFKDIDHFVKTKIIDGPKPDVFELEFWWCQVGRDDLANGECVALSSCRYGKEALLAEVHKLAKGDVRDEIELLVTSSFHSQLKSTEYLPEFLKLLKAASGKRACVLVSRIDVKGPQKVLLEIEYPPLKHGAR